MSNKTDEELGEIGKELYEQYLRDREEKLKNIKNGI